MNRIKSSDSGASAAPSQNNIQSRKQCRHLRDRVLVFDCDQNTIEIARDIDERKRNQSLFGAEVDGLEGTHQEHDMPRVFIGPKVKEFGLYVDDRTQSEVTVEDRPHTSLMAYVSLRHLNLLDSVARRWCGGLQSVYVRNLHREAATA